MTHPSEASSQPQTKSRIELQVPSNIILGQDTAHWPMPPELTKTFLPTKRFFEDVPGAVVPCRSFHDREQKRTRGAG